MSTSAAPLPAPAAAAAAAAAAPPREQRGLSRLLDGPLGGLLPWILMSVLAGPGRFEIAVGAALAVSLAFLLADRVRGRSLKLLGCCDAVFFVSLAVVGALVSPHGQAWLDDWAGEISNVALLVITFGSLAVGTPFTIQYAREQTDPSVWDSPVFLSVNSRITFVWGLAFGVGTIAGAIGNIVLGNPDELWTGWIIQVGALIVAARFTAWYPPYAKARALQRAGKPTPPPPAVAELAIALAGYLPVVGIVVLAAGGGPWWLGVGLIAGGGWLTGRLGGSGDPGGEPAGAS